jgi:hypothetical protein
VLAPIPTCAFFDVLIEPSAAQAAYGLVAPRLLDIPQEKLSVVRGDMQRAAAFVLGVARFVAAPPLRARFARLAGTDEYDDACTADLSNVALAAWYARHRYLMANISRTDVALPVALLDEGMILRERLMSLLEHRKASIPGACEELLTIRASAGCQDFAGDLVALGQLCDRHRAALAEEKWLYRREDASRAQELGRDLLERLGEVNMHQLKSWASMQPRAWTLLVFTYEQVRRAGRFLFAGEEGEARFPSLSSVARGPR